MATPVLALPELIDSQSGKYLTHNEALAKLEVTMVRVKSQTTTAEPGSPVEGDAYILGATHTGTDWAGYAEDDIAHYTGGAWTNYTPAAAHEGMRVWVNDENVVVKWDGSAWIDTVLTSEVTPGAGNDLTVKMGDAAGSNKVSFTDSGDVEVAALDSDGNLQLDGNCETGEVTPGAGNDFVIKMGDAAGSNKISFTDSADAEVGSLDSDGLLTIPNATAGAGNDLTAKMGDAAGSNKISFTDSADVEIAALDSDGNLQLDGKCETSEVTPGAGNNIVVKMGDAAGSNKISFTDSGDVEVSSLDSDGLLTVPGATPGAGNDMTVKMGDAVGANKISFTDSADAEIGSLDSDGLLTIPSATPGAGNDIVVKMGDAAGSNKASFTDSADAEVAALDSDGNLQLDGKCEIDGDLDHDGSNVGFYGTAPIAQAVLATGVGATVDNVITALQNLGLVKQS